MSRSPRRGRAKAPPDASVPEASGRTPERLFAALEMNDFILRHLARIYAAFEGDVLLAMVLGEVAHHNVGRQLPRQANYDPGELARLLEESGRETSFRPCNAYSVSAATGIPYETVRRKVAALVRRGWLTRDGRRNLFVAPNAPRDLRALTETSVDDFLHVVAAVAAGPPRDGRPLLPQERPR